MTIALIDNGSLQPAAHRHLRRLASHLARGCGHTVHAVSWKHSDRIRPAALAAPEQPELIPPLRPDGRAWTLEPWVQAQVAAGERDFVFVPFFISEQGAIGTALRDDLTELQRRCGEFSIRFSGGLAASDALVRIAGLRIAEAIASRGLDRPPVIIVDHGGPSAESAQLRDNVAALLDAQLAGKVARLAAASLEGAEYAHNHPLFADQIAAPDFDRADVLVAPLFLAAGRHAGPRGDLVQIARAAEDRLQSPPLRCHFAGLIGTHPLVPDVLAGELRAALLNSRRRSASPLRSASGTGRSPLFPAINAAFQPSRLSA